MPPPRTLTGLQESQPFQVWDRRKPRLLYGALSLDRRDVVPPNTKKGKGLPGNDGGSEDLEADEEDDTQTYQFFAFWLVDLAICEDFFAASHPDYPIIKGVSNFSKESCPSRDSPDKRSPTNFFFGVRSKRE